MRRNIGVFRRRCLLNCGGLDRKAKARIWGAGIVVAAFLVSPAAHAYPDFDSMRSIFFRSVPAKISAPVVAKVTILELVDMPPNAVRREMFGRYPSKGLARVEAVIKGALNSKTVRVISPDPSDYCDRAFGLGDSGIVIGAVRPVEEGLLELTAESGPANTDCYVSANLIKVTSTSFELSWVDQKVWRGM
jgi:hypothetical protein